MSFMDVMYGGLGQVNNQFQANLGQNAAGMANSNAMVNSWQNTPQMSQAQLYGGGSFGAQPAAYAALGAAYGRATGGFRPQQAAYTRSGQGGIGSDAARVPAAVPQVPRPIESVYNYPYSLGGSSWYPSARTPYGGGGIGSDMRYGNQNQLPVPSLSSRYDWGQSFGTRGGMNADMLRRAGAASPNYYDPQLDQMSQGIPPAQPYANPNYFNPNTFRGGSFPGVNYNQPVTPFGMGLNNGLNVTPYGNAFNQ